MIQIKICLLITDDPDDHRAFYEVVKEVCSNTIVLNVLDSDDALNLLLDKKCVPDYLFLDLTTHGTRINYFLKAIRKDFVLKSIPLLIYGEPSEFSQIEDHQGLTFFDKNYELSELRNYWLTLTSMPSKP